MSDGKMDGTYVDAPSWWHGGRVVVIIPTYNERENLPLIIARVNAATAWVDILVVDDNSPDGTGDVADDLAAANPTITVLHRRQKQGLGGAYLAGFDWALQRGYDAVVEMDADGSHAPEQLPRLLGGLAHADLVIGSRYVPGGAVVNWPWRRVALSRGANLYARVALGSSIRDMTAGYRTYRTAVLRTLQLADVASQGYCFQVDLTWRTAQHGHRIVEVPITFTERAIGESKMDGSIVREACVKIARWGAEHYLRSVLRWARRAKPARKLSAEHE